MVGTRAVCGILSRLVFLLAGLLAATRAFGGDVIHHSIELKLDPGRAWIEAVDVLTIPETIANTGRFEFSLHPELTVKVAGKVIDSVSGAPGRFQAPLTPGQRQIRLEWRGAVPSKRECDWLVESCRLLDERGAYLDGSAGWYPLAANARVSFELKVHLPVDWRSLSQGQLTRASGNAQPHVEVWRVEVPQEDIYLLAGPFHVYEKPGKHAVARVYLRTADDALAQRYLAATDKYLERFSSLIGAYPYPQFAVAESFWETGWGMPSFTLLGSRVLRLPFILDSSLPHEILHNWWGNSVYIDAARGNWAEGLTAYLADYAIQAEQGQGAAYRRSALQKYADYVRRERDFPIRAFRSRHNETAQAVGYNKTLMVLHMVREAIGDAAFFEALRRFNTDFRFRAASFDDLQRAFERAGGKDLGTFFTQWLDRPGAPELALEFGQADAANAGRYRLGFTLHQRQSGEPFALDVPYRIEFPGAQPITGRVELSKASQQFELLLDQRPSALRIDPEFDLFRRLDPSELPPSLGQLFGAPRLAVVLPDQASADVRQAYTALVSAWRTRLPNLEVLSDNQPLPDDAASMIVGWENRYASKVLTPLASEGVTADGESIRVAGRALAKPAHTVVLTTRGSHGQTLGFIGDSSAGDLKSLAARLTHYGKYGFLAFAVTGENVLKGEWEARDSALTWRAPE